MSLPYLETLLQVIPYYICYRFVRTDMGRNAGASKSLLWGVIETDEFYIIIGLKPYQGIQSRHGIIISNEPQHQRMDSQS